MAGSFLILTLALCCHSLPAAFSVGVFGGRSRGFLETPTKIDVNAEQKLRAAFGQRSRASSSSLLFHHEWAMEPVRRSKYLKNFSWKNCGSPSKEAFVMSSLSLTPDSIKIPGNVTLSFKGQLKSTVDKPLKLDLHLEKRELGIWITFPCIDGVGSCIYDDICSKLAPAQCPQPFVQQHVPCKCPFDEGKYTLKDASFYVKSSISPPSGEYRITIKLSSKGSSVGCYEIGATLA